MAIDVLERTGLTPLAFRTHELIRRFDLRAMRRNRAYASGIGPDGLPLPPPRLITLVAGDPDIGWFLESSRTFADSLDAMLSRNGLELSQFGTILDFGCGVGRLIRTFSGMQDVRLLGTDYNPELIGWCRENLPFAEFSVNDLAPPLDYADDSVDFVYAFSVFTHLPENLQRQWITELHRILRPGGYLLITTQGDSYLGIMTESERARYHSGNLVVRSESGAGTNRCAAFHPETYLRTDLLDAFKIVEHAAVSRNETGGVLQDMVLAKLDEHA